MTDTANKITSNQIAIENIEIMPPVDIMEPLSQLRENKFISWFLCADIILRKDTNR